MKHRESLPRESSNLSVEMILNAVGEGIYGLDLEGATTFCNPAAGKILGYEAHELLGRRPHALIHHSRPDGTPYPAHECPIQRTLREGQIQHVTHEVFWKKDGAPVRVEYTCRPVYEKGRLAGAVITFKIIEKHIRMEEEKNRSNLLLRKIYETQSEFFRSPSSITVFENLLDIFLNLSGSRYGFISEVLHTPQGAPYLKAHAARHLDANPEGTPDLPQGWELHDLDNLFGEVVTSGTFVVANNPSPERWAGKLPPGHPPIKTFMGCAIYVQETLVGVVGMANRPQGYGKDLVTFFGALLATCANLLHAFRVEAGRRLAEETVRRREQQYKAVVDNVLDGIITMDESSVIQAINPAAERIFGYPPEEVTGKKFNLFLAGESAQEQEATLREYLATEKPGIIGFTRQVTGVRKDGASFPLELAISEVRTGAERRFLGITRDISETRRVQELREQFASIVENTDDAILGKQLDGTITLWNQAAKRIFGYSELEIVGKHISLLMPADHQAEAAYIVEKVRRGETLSNFETKRVHKNGALFDVSLTASPIRSAKGDIIGVSTISRNITAQKTLLREKEELIKKLEEATLTDPLTNLLNRRGLMQRMEYEVARMRRNGRPFSILLADLDRFKEINDRFGHDEGDRVLVQTAAILTQTTREQDLVCRWGGEEFLIILVETDLEGARHVAEKIRTTFLESSSTPEGEARPATISIGISVFDQPSLSPEEKIKAADECLYKAKSLGRNRVVAEGTRFSSTGEDADSLPS